MHTRMAARTWCIGVRARARACVLSACDPAVSACDSVGSPAGSIRQLFSGCDYPRWAPPLGPHMPTNSQCTTI